MGRDPRPAGAEPEPLQERVYKSLSAVARQVTGVQWNGFSFFGLLGRAEPRHGR